jgi:hypothetical protein
MPFVVRSGKWYAKFRMSLGRGGLSRVHSVTWETNGPHALPVTKFKTREAAEHAVSQINEMEGPLEIEEI